MNSEHHSLTFGIIRTLAYFDLFEYPLTEDEINRFLPVVCNDRNELRAAIESLLQAGTLYQHDLFFALQNNPAWVERRKSGNQLATTYLEAGMKSAQRIASFPFVRAVLISGSLSKGYADSSSDVDFFIITSPGRLWIARMLLALYKRVFLFNSHKFFCINYFVDEQHLEIHDRNMFTAIELGTLIPLYGEDKYKDLIQHNLWIKDYLPQFSEVKARMVAPKMTWIKSCTEAVINFVRPEKIDSFFMYLTQRRWRKMYGQTHSEAEFRQSFKTSPHVSTNHPKNYQLRILEKYEGRLRGYLSMTDPV